MKTALEPDEATELLSQCGELDKTVTTVATKRLVFVKTPSWLQHYWSPEMTVRLEKGEFSDYTTVCCLIGPRQPVWALFAFIYAAILLATLFAAMFGFVQYQTSGSSPWLWVIPFGVIAFSSVFITSKIGQKKGRDQMLHLVSFVYHALDSKGTVERVERR